MHLVYPQTFLCNHRFQFLLGITVVSREVEDNGSETFGGGGGKVHYGLGENGEYEIPRVSCTVSKQTLHCKRCVYNCNDLLSYNSSPRSSHI